MDDFLVNEILIIEILISYSESISVRLLEG